MDTSLGTSLIDIDLDLDGINGPPNFPGWITDVLDRALNAGSGRSKPASEKAIASLQTCDLNSLENKECPICYDPYDVVTDKIPGEDAKEDSSAPKFMRQGHNDELIDEINNKYNTNLIKNNQSRQFNDPSLFFPVDQAALAYSRFPQRSLHTLQTPTKEDILPGYEEVSKSKLKYNQDDTNEKLKNDGHIPVKMPDCDHIFGKTCIVEWLKSNVSCPLCRKEVEESKPKDPKQIKLERLKNTITSHHNNRNEMLDHLIDHSTDVFNPFRRSFNPLITPLTDTYMSQNYANSTFTLPGGTVPTVNVREPNLVLPGRFPISDLTPPPITIARVFNSNIDHRRVRRRPNTFENEGNPQPPETNNDEALNESTSPEQPENTNTNENRAPNMSIDERDEVVSVASSNSSGSSSSSENEDARPFRNARRVMFAHLPSQTRSPSRRSNSRLHPYTRPQLEE